MTCGNGLAVDLHPLVRLRPAMSSKRRHYHSISVEMDLSSEWEPHRMSLSARVQRMNVAFNPLQNYSVQRPPIQPIMELDLMLNTLQKPWMNLSERWKTSGDWIVMQLRKTLFSTRMKHIRQPVGEVLKEKSKPCGRPLERAQIPWLSPIPRDSLDTQWVLELKMQACSMAS